MKPSKENSRFLMEKKALILYDYLQVKGGAEKVFDNFFDLFDDATGLVDYVSPNYVSENPQRTIYQLGNHLTGRLLGQFTTPLNFRFKGKKQLNNFDVTIYSGLYAPFAALQSKTSLNVYYCHTPPRHWYDLRNYYKKNESFLTNMAVDFHKAVFESSFKSALNKMDIVLCNSKNVQNRLKKYVGVDAKIIHPPCDVESYQWYPSKGYYLSTARLEKYKGVDKIVNAFIKMPDKKLIVTSGGAEEKRLKSKVKNSGARNIDFTGWVSDDTLRKLIGECTATLYLPTDEDFGMSPVESMAAGKPVIGVNHGGIKETVIQHETGLLLEPNFIEHDLVDAVQIMDDVKAMNLKSACVARARFFSTSKFLQRVNDVLIEHTLVE